MGGVLLAITIAAQATAASLSFQPTSASLKDNVPAGTVIATGTVKNSDGSTAPSCNLSSGMPSLFGVSG
jgi:hypothetical protein